MVTAPREDRELPFPAAALGEDFAELLSEHFAELLSQSLCRELQASGEFFALLSKTLRRELQALADGRHQEITAGDLRDTASRWMASAATGPPSMAASGWPLPASRPGTPQQLKTQPPPELHTEPAQCLPNQMASPAEFANKNSKIAPAGLDPTVVKKESSAGEPTRSTMSRNFRKPSRKARIVLDKEIGKERGSGESPRTLRSLLLSPKFDVIVCVMIIANALLIGAQVDFQVRRPTAETPSLFDRFELAFCIAFTLELLLRLYVHGWRFFVQPGWGWNIFDAALVIVQIADVVVSAVAQLDIGGAFARSVRVLRMMRLVRVVRILRVVRFIEELRKLLYLIMASFLSFIWTTVLLGILIYVFAVFFTQTVADSAPGLLEELGAEHDLFYYFGSTGDAIFSLFKAITGGADWENISSPLTEHIDISLGVVFALYIGFAGLVILNLVTGVFVDGAMKLTTQDRETELLKKVRAVFKRADNDHSGTISQEEFDREFESREMQQIFHLMDIPGAVASDLFDILDLDRNGSLTDIEFVAGAMNLKGPAKAINVYMLFRDLKDQCQLLMDGLAACSNTLDTQYAKLQRQISNTARPRQMSNVMRANLAEACIPFPPAPPPPKCINPPPPP